MADITPNIVVSMPSQIFTQRREFKSCSNGKIYIGKIDTDPTIAENQIPVYLENEDGKYTPVAQPLIIGTGGYPVYNGQIAKFVTEEGHAMAVYDGDGVQQFYFPNVLKYEPKKAIKELYDALDKKFDKTGGTVNGDVIVEGSLTLMKGDNRKHFCIQNQDGRARMWLYKDKAGDGIHLNNGEDGGGDWLFHKNGNLHTPASIFAGAGATFGGNVTVSWGGRSAIFHENGDVTGPIWGGALSGYLEKKINSVRKRTREVVIWSGTAGTGSTVTTSEDILGALIYLRCPGWDPKNNNYAQVMVPFTVGKATLVSMPRGGWLTIKAISARELEIVASSVDFNEILLSE